jgi:hypothetical protein
MRFSSKGSAERFALCNRALKASVDALLYHVALKLGERAANLKHQLTRWHRGIDQLLVEVHVNAASIQSLKGAQQVNKRPPKPRLPKP